MMPVRPSMYARTEAANHFLEWIKKYDLNVWDIDRYLDQAGVPQEKRIDEIIFIAEKLMKTGDVRLGTSNIDSSDENLEKSIKDSERDQESFHLMLSIWTRIVDQNDDNPDMYVIRRYKNTDNLDDPILKDIDEELKNKPFLDTGIHGLAGILLKNGVAKRDLVEQLRLTVDRLLSSGAFILDGQHLTFNDQKEPLEQQLLNLRKTLESMDQPWHWKQNIIFSRRYDLTYNTIDCIIESRDSTGFGGVSLWEIGIFIEEDFPRERYDEARLQILEIMLMSGLVRLKHAQLEPWTVPFEEYRNIFFKYCLDFNKHKGVNLLSHDTGFLYRKTTYEEVAERFRNDHQILMINDLIGNKRRDSSARTSSFAHLEEVVCFSVRFNKPTSEIFLYPRDDHRNSVMLQKIKRASRADIIEQVSLFAEKLVRTGMFGIGSKESVFYSEPLEYQLNDARLYMDKLGENLGPDNFDVEYVYIFDALD